MSLKNAAALAFLLMLTACGSTRLQTPSEAARQVSQSAQHQALQRCNQYTNMDQYHACRKRVNDEFEQSRSANR